MNLILLDPEDLDREGVARVTGRRATHIREVLKAAAGEPLRVGVLGGKLGRAEVLRVDEEHVSLHFTAEHDPPPGLDLTLLLALPRPKVMRRTLFNLTCMGVKRVFLFNAFRVEKPYWSSEQISPEYIRHACRLGLEQARDTILPEVHLKRLFKPFVEDEVPTLIRETRALLAHPSPEGRECPRAVRGPITLAIGPEGGFIPYEVDLLRAAGFELVSLPDRILNVESALGVLIGRLV